MRVVIRMIAVAALLIGLTPGQARADWLLIPYAGLRFGGSTALFDPELAAGERSYTLGISAALLGGGVLGLEADVGLIPGFFDDADAVNQLVTSSRVTTYGVNAILTLPLSVTRESLRPYALLGTGLLRARADDLGGEFPIDSTMPVVTLGVGVMGYFSDVTGVRFDLRLHRSLGQGDDELERPGHRLRFWRGTLGIIRRF